MLATAPLCIGLHLQRSPIFHDRPVLPLSQLSRFSQPAEPVALSPPASLHRGGWVQGQRSGASRSMRGHHRWKEPAQDRGTVPMKQLRKLSQRHRVLTCLARSRGLPGPTL